jgi:RNA polymerase sigma factor (sigma-70 family)
MSAAPRVQPSLGDAELVELVASGYRDAYAELYQRHASAVRRAISAAVHDPDALGDLVQETFTRSLTKLATLREPALFRPWLLQIAKHVAVDDLRTRRTGSLVPFETDEELPECDDAGPDLLVEVRQLAHEIRVGVVGLSPRDAAVLSMAFHLGAGPAEIAAAFGISCGNAKVILHRARRRLRAALEQKAMLEARTDRR